MQPARRTLPPFVEYFLSAFMPLFILYSIFVTRELLFTMHSLSGALFILPSISFFLVYMLLYMRIVGDTRAFSFTRYDRVTGYHLNKLVVYTLLEAVVYFFIVPCIWLGVGIYYRGDPPYRGYPPLMLSGFVFLSTTIYYAIRLNYRLQPAREQRAANEQQVAADEARKAYEAAIQPVTPPNIAPLLALATEQLINQKCVIIGTSQDSLPIYYREDPGQEERFRHTYIIGASGYGKTTCLCDLVAQDIFHGTGVIVLSAEDDLFPKLLSYIPERRRDDLIYFDPDDTTSPIIGFNPFTHKAGNLNQQTGETITILKRAMGHHELGVTMEPIIDNAVAVLVRRPGATFADLMKLINPADKTVRSGLKGDPTLDENARDFWKQYDETTYYRKSYEAVRNRFSPFARSPISTALATQSFSFKDVMHDRRIIFLDLSQIRDTAVTMGQLLLASIEQSLLTRNPLDEQQLIPYQLYIDEFQLYAEDSKETLIKLFNGSRKRRLGITIAHQTTANIPNELMKTIGTNASTKIVMHLSADDAPHFANQLQIRRAGREAAAPEVLQNLKIGQAYVQTPAHNIGIPITIPINPVVPLPVPVPELKARSKENFGTTQSVPTSENTTTSQPDPPKPPPPQKKKSFGITFE